MATVKLIRIAAHDAYHPLSSEYLHVRVRKPAQITHPFSHDAAQPGKKELSSMLSVMWNVLTAPHRTLSSVTVEKGAKYFGSYSFAVRNGGSRLFRALRRCDDASCSGLVGFVDRERCEERVSVHETRGVAAPLHLEEDVE
jgi:hypothetical protein